MYRVLTVLSSWAACCQVMPYKWADLFQGSVHLRCIRRVELIHVKSLRLDVHGNIQALVPRAVCYSQRVVEQHFVIANLHKQWW